MYKKQKSRQDVQIWYYSVISEKGYHVDAGHFDTYGIQLIGPDKSEVLHDISVDREIVTRMTELFNQHQLFPCHFKDAIEDMLS